MAWVVSPLTQSLLPLIKPPILASAQAIAASIVSAAIAVQALTILLPEIEEYLHWMYGRVSL